MGTTLSSLLPPSLLLLSASTATLLYHLLKSLYRLLLHPLSRHPGPLLNRISSLPYLLETYRGTRHLSLLDLHEKYGDVVRYTPDSLSFSGRKAVEEISEDAESFCELRMGEGWEFNERVTRTAVDQLNKDGESATKEEVSRIITEFLDSLEKDWFEGKVNVDITPKTRQLAFEISATILLGNLGKDMKQVLISQVETHLMDMLEKEAFRRDIVDGLPPFLQGNFIVDGISSFWSRRNLKSFKNLLKLPFDSTSSFPQPENTEKQSSSSPLNDKLPNPSLTSSLYTLTTTLLHPLNTLIFHLSASPFLQQSLLSELQSHIPSLSSTSFPNTHTLTSLPYLTALILESLRLSHSPQNITPRTHKTTRKTVVEGRFLMPGVNVSTTAYIHNRRVENLSSDSGSNPLEFDPERFLDRESFGVSLKPGVRLPASEMSKEMEELVKIILGVVVIRLVGGFSFERGWRSPKEEGVRMGGRGNERREGVEEGPVCGKVWVYGRRR